MRLSVSRYLVAAGGILIYAAAAALGRPHNGAQCAAPDREADKAAERGSKHAVPMPVQIHGSLVAALLDMGKQISELYGCDAVVVDDLEFTTLRMPDGDRGLALFAGPVGRPPTIAAVCDGPIARRSGSR